MEIRDMQMADIENRSAELAEQMKLEDADINTIEAEVQALEERKAQILEEAEQRKAQLEEVIQESKPIEEKEERKMEEMITRNSPEYVRAFAKYIESGDDREVRTLLTENGGGTIAVPEFVYEEVKNAWEEEGLPEGQCQDPVRNQRIRSNQTDRRQCCQRTEPRARHR